MSKVHRCRSLVKMLVEKRSWRDELAQGGKALVALPEDPGFVPRTHAMAHEYLIINPIPRGSDVF